LRPADAELNPVAKPLRSTPRRKPMVPRRRAADTVARLHETLRAMVIGYDIRPDQRVNEVELARRLAVSRTPLREALNRLASEGLLVAAPNRGFRSRPLDTKEIFDLYEARRIIETCGVRLACERATAADIAGLARFWDDAIARSESQGSATKLVRLDEEFHERLLALAGNGELVRALERINAHIHFVRWIDLGREERRRGTYAEHRVLLDALAARDPERCATILGAHISRRLDEIVDVIKEGVVRLYLR
jgi:DNA-binding GntR family transcriptional regulator